MVGKLLKVGFIGAGKMAQALAKGFISAGTSYFLHHLYTYKIIIILQL